MLPIKKIICPTDFSHPSYEGLKTAVELADHFTAELILLHAVSPMPVMAGAGAPTGFHIPAVLEEMEENAAKMLEDIKSGEIKKSINIRTMVVHGRPADEIARLAEEEKAEMIVMATHGQSGWRRLISGSVTERVVRMAPCPVMAVPAPSDE